MHVRVHVHKHMCACDRGQPGSDKYQVLVRLFLKGHSHLFTFFLSRPLTSCHMTHLLALSEEDGGWLWVLGSGGDALGGAAEGAGVANRKELRNLQTASSG